MHLACCLQEAKGIPPGPPVPQMRSPAPGVYVYDFGQNELGWCKLALDSCEAELSCSCGMPRCCSILRTGRLMGTFM
jgi:hypothetical protein